MKRFTKSARLLCTASALALGALSCAAQANGAITIATPFTFDNIDSCNSSSEVGLIVRENVVESLTHLDEATGRPMPRLALSWEPTSSDHLARQAAPRRDLLGWRRLSTPMPLSARSSGCLTPSSTV